MIFVAWVEFLKEGATSLRRLRDLEEDSRVLTSACYILLLHPLIYILTVFWSYLVAI
jgi:hypothetical protein